MTTINSQEDFLRALTENPEWKAAVRAQILGEELLQLPARFDAFVEQMTAFVANTDAFVAEMNVFVAEPRQINADMAQFVAEMTAFVAEQKEINAHLTARMDSLDRNVGRLSDDSGWLKGVVTKQAVIQDAPVIAFQMGLEYVRTVPAVEMFRMAVNAAQGEPLSNELRSFRRADLVIEATDGAVSQYIAVEASFIGGDYDVIRALRNAEMLTEYTGWPARVAIASVRNHDSISRQISSGAVFWHEIEEHELRSD